MIERIRPALYEIAKTPMSVEERLVCINDVYASLPITYRPVFEAHPFNIVGTGMLFSDNSHEDIEKKLKRKYELYARQLKFSTNASYPPFDNAMQRQWGSISPDKRARITTRLNLLPFRDAGNEGIVLSLYQIRYSGSHVVSEHGMPLGYDYRYRLVPNPEPHTERDSLQLLIQSA